MKIFIKILKWIGYILALPFVCISAVFGIIMINYRAQKYIKNKNRYFVDQRYRWLKKLIKKLFFIKRIKIRSHGLRNIPSSPCLFVYNHKSNLDGVLLVDLLIKYQTNYNANFKFSIIAKKETAKVGLIKNILSLLDALYLDREDIRQQFKVFEQQNELIKNKYSILIAPEGTRIHGDELGEFKAGAIKVAYHNMIPIQPIAIYGSDGLMDKNKTHMKKDRIVYVDFLPYKKPFDFHMHNIEWYINEIRDEIHDQYKTIQNKIKSNEKVFPE